jgi:hypothetical protein
MCCRPQGIGFDFMLPGQLTMEGFGCELCLQIVPPSDSIVLWQTANGSPMQNESKEIAVSVEDARPAVELWDQLTPEQRSEFRTIAEEMRRAVQGALTPEDAKSRMLAVLQSKPVDEQSKFNEWFAWAKKHGWDDRTWSQRFILLSLLPSLPLAANGAAGLAIAGTAFRVSIPVVLAAAGALGGAAIDVIKPTRRS